MWICGIGVVVVAVSVDIEMEKRREEKLNGFFLRRIKGTKKSEKGKHNVGVHLPPLSRVFSNHIECILCYCINYYYFLFHNYYCITVITYICILSRMIHNFFWIFFSSTPLGMKKKIGLIVIYQYLATNKAKSSTIIKYCVTYHPLMTDDYYVHIISTFYRLYLKS